MRSSSCSPMVVVIAGSQASGKSTLTAALGAAFRAAGETTAVVELDVIAAMASPTLPDWAVAHRIVGTVVDQWVRAGLDRVIAEGVGSRDEIRLIRDALSSDVPVMTVVLTTSFAIALERAERDPTRDVSRRPGFLRGVYDRWPSELARIEPDVLIDTGHLTPGEGAALVLAAIAR